MKRQLSEHTERLVIWLAHKLPRQIAYWAFIRVWAHATTTKANHPDDLSFKEIAEAWQEVTP